MVIDADGTTGDRELESRKMEGVSEGNEKFFPGMVWAFTAVEKCFIPVVFH